MSNIPPKIPPKKESPIKELSPYSPAAKAGWKYAVSRDETQPTKSRAAVQSKKEKTTETPIASRSAASGKAEKTEMQSTISQIKSERENQQIEIDRLERIIDDAAEEVLDLKTAYDKLDTLSNTLMQKLEKAIENNEYMNSDVQLYKELAEEKFFQVEDLKNENTKLEKDLKESTKNITKLKDDLDKAETHIETLKTTNADLSKKNRSYLAEREATAKEQRTSIGKELSKKPEIKLRNISKEKELDKQNRGLQKELEQMRQELEELTRFKKADDKLNRSLKEENLDLANEARSLNAKNTKQAQEIEKLKADLNKLKKNENHNTSEMNRKEGA